MTVVYHVLGTSWDIGTPLGSFLGLLISFKYYMHTPTLECMANGAFGFGMLCMIFGVMRLVMTAFMGTSSSLRPWTTEGIQQRADDLNGNYKVRTLDLTVWSFMGLSVVQMLSVGVFSPPLVEGTWGVIQTLSLASALGGVVGVVLIVVIAARIREDEQS
eukprot:CAMPEP_0116822346 /NCGR_PEP_ID=MMETSP0418-20121206/216_1 /TAXON_ID=1158023 /ORGANISM="Astrosyne radiata, Strain 13vi08-1A" /LENGTH=159 /DNA_ID=CAMNT_0004450447 /DNA_START=182 /DNA_END=661 /DNA_ORIENTATION=-